MPLIDDDVVPSSYNNNVSIKDIYANQNQFFALGSGGVGYSGEKRGVVVD